MLCSEYGWSVEQVFDCTKEQIDALCKSIGKRREVNQKFQAGIHGAELKQTRENTIDIDKDFDKLKSMNIPIVEE